MPARPEGLRSGEFPIHGEQPAVHERKPPRDDRGGLDDPAGGGAIHRSLRERWQLPLASGLLAGRLGGGRSGFLQESGLSGGQTGYRHPEG